MFQHILSKNKELFYFKVGKCYLNIVHIRKFGKKKYIEFIEWKEGFQILRIVRACSVRQVKVNHCNGIIGHLIGCRGNRTWKKCPAFTVYITT